MCRRTDRYVKVKEKSGHAEEREAGRGVEREKELM